MDKLIHGTAADGTIRVMAAVTTGITAEAIRRHKTSPTVSAAFGRVLTGTLLLAATFKEFDRVTVKIESSGPVEGITAEATPDGTVRGFVKNPAAELPIREDGKFNVKGVVGDGTFYVVRESGFDIGLHKEPYIGSVPIVSGEIAEDFAFYLAKSEQIPSAVLLGVLLHNTEPFVKASGGVMVQIMPGANEHLITMIEDTIARAPHVTDVIRDGGGPEDLLRLALGVIDFKVLGEREVEFKCNCSIERAHTLIASLGQKEVESMLREDKGAVMTCGFCNEEYRLGEDDLRGLLESETN
jgi:molecular chaperone Hsp33